MQEVNLQQRDFPTEIVKAIEAGVNRHLNNSLVYSPFKMAFNLFKKANPRLMDQIRGIVRNDIHTTLSQIPGYNPGIFLMNDQITPKGKQMLKISYNIGIHLMKKQLNVMMAFKALYNAPVRNQVYTYILQVTQRSVSRIMHSNAAQPR